MGFSVRSRSGWTGAFGSGQPLKQIAVGWAEADHKSPNRLESSFVRKALPVDPPAHGRQRDPYFRGETGLRQRCAATKFTNCRGYGGFRRLISHACNLDHII